MEYIFEDVNEAFPVMWHRLWSDDGVIVESSRNGPVRRSIYPVTTIFRNPFQRVLFDKNRDCNPFFHLFEAIWMLAGRNEVQWLAKFNKRMLTFSDDGLTLVSSYGYRWKKILGIVIDRLYNNKNTRRAYIPLFWTEDCLRDGKDIPCNTGIAFYIRDGMTLDMTVFNRSNDMVYGAYGANVVHFSLLQEYVAAAVDCDVGFYAQISANFHLYTEFDVTKRMIGKIPQVAENPYVTEPTVSAGPYWILSGRDQQRNWQEDARYFIDVYTTCPDPKKMELKWRTPFFAFVAAPMYRGWHAFTQLKQTDEAFAELALVEAGDWHYAGTQWMQNRLKDRIRKELKDAADLKAQQLSEND